MKRGQSDTSKPGAFCKDQCTFDGCMRIIEQRNEINFKALYAGKVSLETYYQCEEALINASNDDVYITPP